MTIVRVFDRLITCEQKMTDCDEGTRIKKRKKRETKWLKQR